MTTLPFRGEPSELESSGTNQADSQARQEALQTAADQVEISQSIQTLQMQDGTLPTSESSQNTSPQAGKKPATHSRNYQACIACRIRKVKCDRGNVDNPDDPPCHRCRRESKGCYFSDHRRKRKNSLGSDDEHAWTDNEDGDNQHDNRPARKRTNSSAARPNDNSILHNNTLLPVLGHVNRPLTPGGSVGRAMPLQRPGTRPRTRTVVGSDEEEQRLSLKATAALQRGEILEPHDSLASLFSTEGASRPSRDEAECMTGHSAQQGYASAIGAWSRFRFVLEGWLSAHECIDYIRYFYRFLAPLTPVPLDAFRDLEAHKVLITEEPMLCMTLLAIASRYMDLHGYEAKTRAYAIHEKFYRYLQNMVNSLTWGDETTDVTARAHYSPDAPKGFATPSLRSIGTIESLLVLTEWHSRSIHFPPKKGLGPLFVETPKNEGLSARNAESPVDPDQTAFIIQNPSIHVMDNCLDPCVKSDKICWSLLTTALALAYERGLMSSAGTFPGSLRRRVGNIRRLLYVYLTLTAGRLSFPSMISEAQWQALFAEDHWSSSLHSVDLNIHSIEFRQDCVVYFWYGLAEMYRYGNRELFPGRDETRRIVEQGLYPSILDTLQDMHRKWLQEFEDCRAIDPQMRQVLLIDYNYLRTISNNVALQAVMLRCVKNANNSPETVIKPGTLNRWLGDDRQYIKEIVSGSRAVLRIMAGDIVRGDLLKHAPVRTFFRIIAVCMILLKTFAMGASEEDAALTLSLLDGAVHAMQQHVVDDVHISRRFAEQLRSLTRRVRTRIVRVVRGTEANGQAAIASSSSPSSHRGAAARSTGLSERRGVGPIRTLGLSTSQDSQARDPFVDLHAPPPAQAFGQGQPDATMGDYFELNTASASMAQGTQQHGQGGSLPSPNPFRDMPPVSPYNPLNPEFSIMPPPSFSFNYGQIPQPGPIDPRLSGYGNVDSSMQPSEQHAFGSGTADATTSAHTQTQPHEAAMNMGQQLQPHEWFALPLDNILNTGEHAGVNHWGFGPDFGNRDMLDVLLERQEQDEAMQGE